MLNGHVVRSIRKSSRLDNENGPHEWISLRTDDYSALVSTPILTKKSAFFFFFGGDGQCRFHRNESAYCTDCEGLVIHV